MSVPGNGKPAGEILPTAGRPHSASQSTAGDQEQLGVGTRPRGGIFSSQGGIGQTHCTGSLRPKGKDQSIRRCFVIWTVLQQEDSEWRLVAYTSRALSETERRYAQIEKEALAVTWSKLNRSKHQALLHKPFVTISGSIFRQ